MGRMKERFAILLGFCLGTLSLSAQNLDYRGKGYLQILGEIEGNLVIQDLDRIDLHQNLIDFEIVKFSEGNSDFEKYDTDDLIGDFDYNKVLVNAVVDDTLSVLATVYNVDDSVDVMRYYFNAEMNLVKSALLLRYVDHHRSAVQAYFNQDLSHFIVQANVLNKGNTSVLFLAGFKSSNNEILFMDSEVGAFYQSGFLWTNVMEEGRYAFYVDSLENFYFTSSQKSLRCYRAEDGFKPWFLPLKPSNLSSVQFVGNIAFRKVKGDKLFLTGRILEMAGNKVSYNINGSFSKRPNMIDMGFISANIKPSLQEIELSEVKLFENVGKEEPVYYNPENGGHYGYENWNQELIELNDSLVLVIRERYLDLQYNRFILDLQMLLFSKDGKVLDTYDLGKQQNTVVQSTKANFASYSYQVNGDKIRLAYYEVPVKDRGEITMFNYRADEMADKKTMKKVEWAIWEFSFGDKRLDGRRLNNRALESYFIVGNLPQEIKPEEWTQVVFDNEKSGFVKMSLF